MDNQETTAEFTPKQRAYIEYLAAGQIDENGKRITKEEFAKTLGMDWRQLYHWQNLTGFWDQVAERADYLITRRYPKILNSMYAQSLKGNVQAATFLTKQGNRLKADKVETNTVGELTIKFE